MAVICDQYYCDEERFYRKHCLDGNGNLNTPIPLAYSSYSGFGFIDLNYGDILATLTFKTAGSVTVTLSNKVLYESSLLHGNQSTYEILGGNANGTAMYLELYNSGTNTVAYSKYISSPYPNEESSVTLSVESAGTYDLKIRCAQAYTFYDMWSENDEEILDSSNVDEIYVD